MLSEKAIKALSIQQFDPDSDWEVNLLPFGSINWEDEWPETLLAELFGQVDDLSIIHAMFEMRLKIWNGEALNAQDRALWDGVKLQVPKWALFERLGSVQGANMRTGRGGAACGERIQLIWC